MSGDKLYLITYRWVDLVVFCIKWVQSRNAAKMETSLVDLTERRSFFIHTTPKWLYL